MDGGREESGRLRTARRPGRREAGRLPATAPEDAAANGPAADGCGPAPWRASIDLEFRRIGAPAAGGVEGEAARKTVLARREHAGPVLVQRPFHPGDGACHVYVLHPPGGIARGDRIDVRVRADPGARALLTTPAATKVYRSGERSVLTHRLEVRAGASLEWLPQETILYGGSRIGVRTEVRLDPAARFASWEIIALGRLASGDGYASGEACFGTEVTVGGEPRLIERQRWRRGAGCEDAVLRAPWGFAGRRVLAAFYAYPADGDVVDRARTLLPQNETCAATLVDGLLVVRVLDDDTCAARGRLAGVWSELRPLVTGLPPHPPRIWAT